METLLHLALALLGPDSAVAAGKPAHIDPKTGSTAGRPPATPDCVTLYANGKILAESPTFRRFMASYPKPAGREKAADAWNLAMIAGHDPEYLIAALATEPSLHPFKAEDRKYIVKAENWIADCKWLCVKPPQPKPPPVSEEEAERLAADRKKRRQAEAEADERNRLAIEKMNAEAREKGIIK